MRFVVYEVWTRARVLDADSWDDASAQGEPSTRPEGMHLSNWHVVPIEDPPRPVKERRSFHVAPPGTITRDRT